MPMNQTISLKIAKTLLKRIYFVIGLFLISFNLIAKIELLDRVVAVVDSGIIMESQLNSRVEEILVRLKSDKAELPPLNLLEEQVLDRLIIEAVSYTHLTLPTT